MTPNERIERYFLARLLYWRDTLDTLDAQAVAQLIKVLESTKADVLAKLAADADGLARITDWNRERLIQVNAWLTEATTAAQVTTLAAITESSVTAAVASLATYNAMLSFEGRAAAVQTVGMTAEQIRTWFQRTPLQGGTVLSDWVGKAFENGVNDSVITAIQRGGLEGKGTAAMVKDVLQTALDDGFAITQREAITLTRTYTQTANVQAMEAVIQANSDIIKGYKRIETLDNKTCMTCFVGETVVQPIGQLRGISKRLYSGETVVITTATGKKLEGTPNHPILTPQGWLPLGEFKPGQQVINTISSEVGGILGIEDVGVPTPLSELYDSIDSLGIAEVYVKSPSPNDFHGDGMRCDEKIDVPNAALLLRDNVCDTCGGKLVENKSFAGLHDPAVLFTGCKLFKSLLGALEPFDLPSQVSTVVFKNIVKPASRPLNGAPDLFKLYPTVKHRQGTLSSNFTVAASIASFNVFHNAEVDKKRRDSGCGDSILSCETASGFPGSVFVDDVVSVRRQARSCHVYNLHCCQGLYTASGMIVKNCALADGATYGLHEPRPQLPCHPGCRGIYTLRTKSWRDFGIDMDDLEETTRPWVMREPGAIGTGGRKILEYGQTTENFSGWWESLSATQKAKTSIGPVRGKLLESGAVKWDDLWDRASGLPYTLKELGYSDVGERL